jgi:hypothetical protein
VGRFDREDPNPEQEHAHAEAVADRLRANVEREVRAVVDEAIERALAIEDRAVAKASETQRESQERADEILRESGARAGEVLDTAGERAEKVMAATHTLEQELYKVIGSFREEIRALKEELESAKADLLRATPGPARSHSEAIGEGGEGSPAPVEEISEPSLGQAPGPERRRGLLRRK